MRYIKLSENNKVISIRTASSIVDGEIESEIGDIGQVMQEDGSFITPVVEPQTPAPTLEQRLAEIKEDNLILMDVLATMYEDMLAKGTV